LKRCWPILLFALAGVAAYGQEEAPGDGVMPAGDAQRGRLVFGACRTCHYPDAFMGHNNGPNLHRIFGRVAGKQAGFEYYSETFKQAEFVWTPQLLYRWLADPLAMFPETTMMSLGVPDPQQRADLIAYLKRASVRDAATAPIKSEPH
jgi:cytochrome c